MLILLRATLNTVSHPTSCLVHSPSTLLLATSLEATLALSATLEAVKAKSLCSMVCVCLNNYRTVSIARQQQYTGLDHFCFVNCCVIAIVCVCWPTLHNFVLYVFQVLLRLSQVSWYWEQVTVLNEQSHGNNLAPTPMSPLIITWSYYTGWYCYCITI